jgi:hypothetical protein
MKRFVSTALVVVLLLGLGTFAVLARGGGDILTPAGNAVAAAAQSQTAAAPDAPLSSKYNMIALPLDVQANWSDPNNPVQYAFDSQGLAEYVGLASVEQVLHWDPAPGHQRYDSWFIDSGLPNGGYGYVNNGLVTDPWSLTTGHVYRLLLNNTSSSLTSVSFVGDVPDKNSLKFTLYGADACQYNEVSVPLEQATLTTSRALADSMGGMANVAQVLQWNASLQLYNSWFPDDSLENGGYGYIGTTLVTAPWSVDIGYPYRVCLLAGAQGDEWPANAN